MDLINLNISWQRHYFVIGITGAPGSGKSTVTGLLAKLGAIRLSADEIAHSILHSPELRDKFIELLGPEIINNDKIDHQAIARIVFNNPEKREGLNNIIHPRVRSEANRICNSVEAGAVVAYEIPLLFESGREKEFDLTITVSAPTSVRLNRVQQSHGWAQDEFERREAAQLPLTEKEKRADLVVVNDSSLADLKKSVTEIYNFIIKLREEQNFENKNILHR